MVIAIRPLVPPLTGAAFAGLPARRKAFAGALGKLLTQTNTIIQELIFEFGEDDEHGVPLIVPNCTAAD